MIGWRLALIGSLLAAVVVAGFAASHYRDKAAGLQESNRQLSGQLDWQNRTQRAVVAIDEHRTRELNDAKSKIDDLQRAVESGRQRLRISATCPSTAAAGVANAAGPRLTDAAERNYFTLRKRIETARSQIAALQDHIRKVCLEN